MRTVIFSLASGGKECGVLLYEKGTYRLLNRLPFQDRHRIGRLWRMSVTLEADFLYQYYEGDRRFPDPKGRCFVSPIPYGGEKREEDIYTALQGDAASLEECSKETDHFEWQESHCPKVPYEDSLVYCLHVRGFTKHSSSGVRAPGTFAGVIEKIPYLKKTGVTTLEFQPVYEFNECVKPVKYTQDSLTHVSGDNKDSVNSRINYWGYIKAYYFAPKSAYSYGPDPVKECKTMIRELHKQGLEVILQFYFPREFNPLDILEVLRFWVVNYKVDGFRLMGEELPAMLLAQDPLLAETKLWYENLQDKALCDKDGAAGQKYLGLMRDDYLYDMRRFLKGEEGCIPAVMYHLRSIPQNIGRIHYLTSYWGLTLMDLVSYDRKHNEENGEDNRDGGKENYSWNCGEEGPTRKRKVMKLRRQQYRNALMLLFFSQSTPRIFMGDEFGNSQKGNNNPYCQDNEITWLDWQDFKKNHKLYEFFTYLAALRREHPILHPRDEMKMMDYISCGYPDYSYHGETAWKPNMDSHSRQLGIMYCGQYAVKTDRSRDDMLYLAINMHWEEHALALPRLEKGMDWRLVISTCEDMGELSNDMKKEENDKQKKNSGNERMSKLPTVVLPPRTIAVYKGTKIEGVNGK